MGRDRCAAQQRGAPLRRKLGALLRGGAARGAGLSVVGLPGPGILAGRSRAAGCLRAGTKPVRRRGEGGSPGPLRERLLSDAPLPTAAPPREPCRARAPLRPPRGARPPLSRLPPALLFPAYAPPPSPPPPSS